MNTLEKIKKAAVAASMAIAVSGAALLGAWAQTRNDGEKHSGLRSTIAFVSSRHDPAADPAVDAQRARVSARQESGASPVEAGEYAGRW